jgi:hypothetical protein
MDFFNDEKARRGHIKVLFIDGLTMGIPLITAT